MVYTMYRKSVIDTMLDRFFLRLPPNNSNQKKTNARANSSGSSTGYHSHLVEHTADVVPTAGFVAVGVVVVHMRSTRTHVRWTS